MTETRFRQAFLLILVAAISVAFVAMIRSFLVTILLAAIFAGLSYPVYQWMLRRLGGRRAMAAIATLVLLLALVIAPLLAVLGAGATEALRVSETIRPGLQRLVDQPGEIDRLLRAVPGYQHIEPYRGQILTKAGELVGGTSAFFFAALSATTRATGLFVFHFFVLLYTMFYFLTGGPALLEAVLAYLPLTDADKQRMVGKFVSVTRATLKGTVLIGALQGLLGGVAFWAAGLDGAIFWGTAMTVLSIVPGIGGALVWVPASIILVATGEVWRGIGLALFCALIVGSVDNVLRPRLVGQDTKMHELLIFFSTLGGLLLFGAMGFILGPILAALFVTAWEMFGTAFRSELAEPVGPKGVERVGVVEQRDADSNPDVLRGHRGSVVEECLGGDDVLGARALRALADGERHALAFAHGVEWRTRARGLVKEVFGALRRGDEAEALVRDALDGAVGRHG